MEGNSFSVEQLNQCRREQMLAAVLLHMIAAALNVDQPAYFCAGRKHLRDSVPHFTCVGFKNILDRNFERHSRFGFCPQSSGIKRLATAGWIKRSTIQFHRPRGLVSVALEFLRVRHVGAKGVKKGVVVVETFGHSLSELLAFTYRRVRKRFREGHDFQSRRPSSPFSVSFFLVRPNNPADLASSGLLRSRSICGTHYPHCLRDHVDVLKTSPRVKNHDFITRLQKSTGEQLVIGCCSCSSFRTQEDSFVARPLEQRSQHVLIGDGDRRSSAAAHKIQNQVVAICLGNAKSGGKCVRVFPCLRNVLPFLEGFRYWRATASLDCYHFGTLRS